MESFRLNPDIYFVHLDPKTVKNEIIDERLEILALKRLDTTVQKDIIWKGNTSTLYRDIVSRWESSNRYNIIQSIEDIKKIIKELSSDEKREAKWMELINDEIDPLSYTFQLNYVSKSYLISSF